MASIFLPPVAHTLKLMDQVKGSDSFTSDIDTVDGLLLSNELLSYFCEAGPISLHVSQVFWLFCWSPITVAFVIYPSEVPHSHCSMSFISWWLFHQLCAHFLSLLFFGNQFSIENHRYPTYALNELPHIPPINIHLTSISLKLVSYINFHTVIPPSTCSKLTTYPNFPLSLIQP